MPTVTCKEPEKLTGLDLSEIEKELCTLFDDGKLDAWVIVLIVIIIIVMIILIFGIIWYFFRNWLNCGHLKGRFSGREKTQRHRPKKIKRPSSGVVTKAEIVVIPDEDIPGDLTKYRSIENIYEDPAEMPLGSAKNYPDIKTTVL